jgi:hypothetical protein
MTLLTTEAFSPIRDDLAQGLFQSSQNNLYACILIVVVALDARHRGAGTQQRDAAARNNTFLNRCTGCVQGVFNARFFLFHLDFRGGTHFDQRDSAGQLGHALLQFLFVIVAGGFFD